MCKRHLAREIKKIALKLYFDQDGCNVFLENEFDCISSVCNEFLQCLQMSVCSVGIDGNNDLWDYLVLKVKIYSFPRQCFC